MLVAAAPYALLWPAAMIVWGPGYTSSKHRRHCVQLVMALAGRLRIRGGAGRGWKACGAALIRPDASHEVDAADARILLAFVDAESDLGAALLVAPANSGQRIDERSSASRDSSHFVQDLRRTCAIFVDMTSHGRRF